MKNLLQPQLLLWLILPLLSVLLFPLIRDNESLFKLLDGALSINVLLFSIVVHEHAISGLDLSITSKVLFQTIVLSSVYQVL